MAKRFLNCARNPIPMKIWILPTFHEVSITSTDFPLIQLLIFVKHPKSCCYASVYSKPVISNISGYLMASLICCFCVYSLNWRWRPFSRNWWDRLEKSGKVTSTQLCRNKREKGGILVVMGGYTMRRSGSKSMGSQVQTIKSLFFSSLEEVLSFP